MICSFTQTYGTNRGEIYKYKNNDHLDILFRNYFDLNLYCFHNSSKDYVAEVTKDNSYFTEVNFSIRKLNNLPYTLTLKNNLHFLKSKGCEKLFFAQDDAVTCPQHVTAADIKSLFDFIGNAEFEMLYLEKNIDDFKHPNDYEVIHVSDAFKVYRTTTFDFVKNDVWSFDDGSYVASLDFLLNTVYDETYFNAGDVWSSEHLLNDKFKKVNIDRLVTNKTYFHRSNILGPNNWNRAAELAYLEQYFSGK